MSARPKYSRLIASWMKEKQKRAVLFTKLNMGKFKPSHQPANLKRFRGLVQNFIDDNDAENDKRRFMKPKRKGPSRKEKRKEEKRLKKLRKQAFSEKKKLPTQKSLRRAEVEKKMEEEKKKRQERGKKQREEHRLKLQEKEIEMREAKTKEVKEQLKEEDKEIKHLAKQLKMNKRKSKTLPLMFINDGLDYLLEVTDSEKMKFMREEGDEDMMPTKSARDIDADSDEDEFADEDYAGMDGDEDDEIDSDELPSDDDDLDESITVKSAPSDVKGIIKKRKEKIAKHVSFGSDEEEDEEEEEKDESEEEEEESEDMVQEDDDQEEDMDESQEEGEDEMDEEEEEASEIDEDLKEDIYGRLRDKEGNVVSANAEAPSSGSYIPPGKRLQMAESVDEKKKIEMERTKRQIKGLVNRLSEANMHGICSEMEGLYMRFSRALLTECLSEMVLDACTGVASVPERLVMELCVLISILHVNVGNEIGANFLQSVIKLFDSRFRQGGSYGQGKEMDNIVLLIAHLCNFKVVHSMLIFDLFKKFISGFKDRDIELILLLLKSVGFTIRKDDPMGLKEIIVEIQNKASSADSSKFQDQSRMKFMLEILLAVKNNNMKKIPSYDPAPVEQLRKTMKNIIRTAGVSSEAQLRISMDDLLQAETKGRWWVVGSAWSGKGVEKREDSKAPFLGDVSSEILELARKQRMNTEVRKNIFCVLMMCEDFADAFEKLLRIGLKHTQEREIIHVILDTALQEKTYNPFYAHLLLKFCEYHKRFKMTVQFSFWDKFKELEKSSEIHVNNMAALLTFLIVTKALSLAVFKVIEFADLDKQRVRFLKRVLLSLLLDHPEQASQDAFLRIASLPKLNVLREGLKLFMRHFMLKKPPPHVAVETLRSRVEAAVRILSLGESSMGL